MSDKHLNVVVFIKFFAGPLVKQFKTWCAERYPNVKVVFATTAEEIEAQGMLCKDVDVLLMWMFSPDQVIGFYKLAGPAETRRLRWVHSSWAGLNAVICPELVADENAILTRTCDTYNHSLAEAVIFGLMYWEKQTPLIQSLQKQHKWERFMARELRGNTLVIVGFGNIGQTTGRLAKAAGCRVIGVRRREVKPEEEETLMDKSVADRVVDGRKLKEVLGEADYVACVLPLTKDTEKYFGKAEFEAMKPGALFVNIGRGPTVDEKALIEGLSSKKIRAAYLDVVEKEPLPEDSPLWDLDNVLITAHTIDFTERALPDAYELMKQNFERYMRGEELLYIADKSAGY